VLVKASVQALALEPVLVRARVLEQGPELEQGPVAE
jgi:hypothetical protein